MPLSCTARRKITAGKLAMYQIYLLFLSPDFLHLLFHCIVHIPACPPSFFFPCGDICRPPLLHFPHLHPGVVCAHLQFVYVRGVTGGSGMQWKSLWGNIRESVISWHSRSLPAGCLLKTGMVALEETADRRMGT